MKYFVLTSLIVSFVCQFSCQGQVLSFHRQNGQKYCDISIEGSKKNGKCTYYYPNGSIASEANYQENLLDGEVNTYYLNGNIKSSLEFSRVNHFNTNQIKSFKFYDESGIELQLIEDDSDISFIDGLLWSQTEKKPISGILYTTSSSSYTDPERKGKYVSWESLRRIATYKDGIQNGEAIEYHSTGEIASQAVYIDGEIYGNLIEYFPSGLINKEALYRNVYNDCLIIQYREDGTVSEMRTEDKHGKVQGIQTFNKEELIVTLDKYSDQLLNGSFVIDWPEGSFTDYFPDKSVRRECKAIDTGYRETLYNSSGTLLREMTYDHNFILNGKASYYDTQGLKYWEGNFENGLKHGACTFLDPKGKAFVRNQFLNGKLAGEQIISLDNNSLLKLNLVILSDTAQFQIRHTNKNGQSKNVINQKEVYVRDKNTYLKANGKLFTGLLLNNNRYLNTVSTYKNGTKNGLSIVFYKSGELFGVDHWVKGKKEGLQTWYTERANLEKKTNYVDGSREGQMICFQEKGEISELYEYKEGLLTGESYSLNEYGEIINKKSHHLRIETLLDNSKIYYIDEMPEERTFGLPYHMSFTIKTSKSGLKNGKYVEEIDGKTLKIYTLLNGQYHGTREDFYVNGNIKKRSTFERGVPQGEIREYHTNGKPMHIYTMKDAKLHGKYEIFDQEGNLVEQINYQDGFKTGCSLQWYASGSIMDSLFYGAKSIKIKSVSFLEDGMLNKRTYYKGDSLHVTMFSDNKPKESWNEFENRYYGFREFYDQDGDLETIVYYKDFDHVESVSHYKKSVLFESFETNDSMKEKVGFYKQYYSNGNHFILANYENNYLSGSYYQYYLDGKIKSECYYVYGVPEGNCYNYYNNGTIQNEIHYFEDSAHHGETNFAEHIEYTEDGKVSKKYSTAFGELHGRYMVFDSNGEKISEENFEYGTKQP